METFLTKTSQKKITMLHFLLERDQWCSIEELQNELGVSAKSVLNYLSEMEELFQQYHGKIVLKNEGNKRFFLEKHENFPIYTIYLHFYRSSYNYQLIDYMYKNPEKNLEAYAKEQFTSVSTVFRYAKLLVKYFARYQMLFHPYQLTIEAEESSIRSFYYYFYWNSARSGDWPFQTSQREIVDYLNCFEAIYEVRLAPLQKRSFSYWLVITIERSRFFKVTINEDQKSVIREDPYFSFINQWLKASSLDFDISESYFLYQVIYFLGSLMETRSTRIVMETFIEE